VNFISAIAIVSVLYAGFCPALCAARSADPTVAHLNAASAPEEVPCHPSNNAPSRGDTDEDCDTDCSRFDVAAISSFTTRVGPEISATAFSAAPTGLLLGANAAPFAPRERVSGPPPRNLLLVKNSFQI
jgi:hypothetical protein